MSSAQISTVGRAVTSAQPYAWPYHGNLETSRCALVACVDPAWRIAGPESDAGDRLMLELAAALRQAGGLVIAMTSVPMRRPAGLEDPRAGAAGDPTGAGSDLTAELRFDLELTAGGTSAFYESRLDSILRAGGYQDLLLAGWGLEGPVHSTMRAANDSGYECLLVPDACTSLAPALAFAACEMVRFSGGIFGAFADAADVIQTLAGFTVTKPADHQ